MERHIAIVGGGPCGVMLGYLLARAGLEVTVLERRRALAAQGEVFTAASLRVFREAGFSERILALRHNKVTRWEFFYDEIPHSTWEFQRLSEDFPFLFVIPAGEVLDFLATEARDYHGFDLRLGAEVTGIIEENGEAVGVRFQDEEGPHQLAAKIVIGADGAESSVRRLAQVPLPEEGVEAYEVVCLKAPAPERWPDWLAGTYLGSGAAVSCSIDREGAACIQAVCPRGGLAASGDPESLRMALANRLPSNLASWLRSRKLAEGQPERREVRPFRVEKWFRPGLLLLGDAARVLPPLGPWGLGLGLRDAVVAANHLVRALRGGQGITPGVLAAIEAERLEEVTSVEKKLERAAAVFRRTSGTRFLLRYKGLRSSVRPFLGHFEKTPAVRLEIDA